MTAPKHLPPVSCSICYRDRKAALEWLEQAFGFEPFMVILGENDEVIRTCCGALR